MASVMIAAIKITVSAHATTLVTASASAQTPIHSASTAIVPKATRPMPVIASLIGVSIDLRSFIYSVNAGTGLPFVSTRVTFRLHPLRQTSACPSELSAKLFWDFWRQEFVCGLNVRHATSSAFKNIQVGQVVKSRCYSNEPHDLSAAWAKRRL